MVKTNDEISIKNIPVVTFSDSFAEVGQGRWEGCRREERTAGGRAAKSQNPNEVISITGASSQQGCADGGTEGTVGPVWACSSPTVAMTLMPHLQKWLCF